MMTETITPTTTLSLIEILGRMIRDAVDYDGKARDLENLRKVHALNKAGDSRWIKFLALWTEETKSSRCASAANSILDHHYDLAMQADERAEDERVAEFKMERDAKALENFRATRPARLKFPESDGMYRNPQTGEIWKVQWNKAQGDGARLYAKQMVGWTNTDLDAAEAEKLTQFPLAGKQTPMDVEFVFVRGGIFKIDDSWKMTLEEAKAFGALYGTCCVCGRTLTDEKSIAAGIGPKCAQNF